MRQLRKLVVVQAYVDAVELLFGSNGVLAGVSGVAGHVVA